MKVGIGFFVTAYSVDAVTLATAIEAAGFDSFWVPDHTVLPVNPATKYPGGGDGRIPNLYGEMADPFVLLAFAGAVTKHIKLCTGVCLVPERHPLTLAKTVGTLDNFSGGRVILGVGSGWLPEETELYGTNFADRWPYTRESVMAMKKLWRDGTASFDGKFVRFPEVRCDPMSASRPTPPVIIGAPGSPLTYKRAATWCDGWLPVMAPPEKVAEGRREITRICEENGRDASEIQITVFAMDATPATQRAYEDAGADRLVVGIWNHPGTYLPFEQWATVRSEALRTTTPPAADTMRVLEQIHQLAQL